MYHYTHSLVMQYQILFEPRTCRLLSERETKSDYVNPLVTSFDVLLQAPPYGNGNYGGLVLPN